MCGLRREYLIAEIDGISMPPDRFLGAMRFRVESNLVAPFFFFFFNKAGPENRVQRRGRE